MPDNKEVTIYDIAEKLKISPTTVSRGLQDHPTISQKTKKKITDMVEELGYRSNHFARNLRQKQTRTIGVIVGKLNSNFQSQAIAGIESVANAEGYNLIISQSSESSKKEAASAKTMFDNRVDGLLVSLAYDTEDLSHFDPFFKKNIPVIFFDRVVSNDVNTVIKIENRKAAYEITKHLIGEGCKRIVHITAPLKQNVYVERFQGYKDALEEGKLKFKESNLIICNLSQEAGVAAAETILKMKPLPDGVFVANDNCAVSCLLTLKQKGIRIPEDIAFAGFNNDSVSQVVEPNLTTINYSGYKMGEIAGRQMINHLDGTAQLYLTNSIILRSELIVRASSKKTNG